MIDPTKGIGSLQGLISGSRVSEPSSVKRNTETRETSNPQDQVSLSPEALSLSEAKEAYTRVRSLVEQDTSLSLSSGGRFDESL